MLATASIIKHFSSLEDPRASRQKKHELTDIFFITISTAICGADNWIAIEEFGKAKEDWFTERQGVAINTPSHDTFGDAFATIDTENFSGCFSNWFSNLACLSKGDVIAIDGKCIRSSIDNTSTQRL
ncbi:ISAs1 family transposase [Pseudomonadota bacterium]